MRASVMLRAVAFRRHRGQIIGLRTPRRWRQRRYGGRTLAEIGAPQSDTYSWRSAVTGCRSAARRAG